MCKKKTINIVSRAVGIHRDIGPTVQYHYTGGISRNHLAPPKSQMHSFYSIYLAVHKAFDKVKHQDC